MTPSRSLRLVSSSIVLVLAGAAAAQGRAPGLEAAVVEFSARSSVDSLLDFDGDGDVDGVGWFYENAPADGYRLAVQRNDGSAGFTEQVLWSSSGTKVSTWALAVGNLDGDGFDDFVVAFDEQVVVYAGSPTGPVMLASWFEAQNVADAVVADFDGDGLDDIVLATDELRLYHDDGGSFSLASTCPGNAPLRRAELTGDGQIDLFYEQGDAIAVVAVRGGVMTPVGTVQHGIAPSENPMLTAGDIDGDGDDDVVVFAEGGSYVVLRHTLPATLTAEPRSVGGPATGLADIDGDGDLDGICCGGGGPSEAENTVPSVYHLSLNDGSGRFAPAWEIEGLGSKRIAGAADIDGDGDVDLVAGRTVFFDVGSFVVTPQPKVDLRGSTGIDAQVTDYDGDGDLDVWINGPLVAENDGEGGCSVVTLALPPAPAGTFFRGEGYRGDYDGDGDPDLILGQTTLQTFLGMRLLRNDGGGLFSDGGYAAAAGQNFSRTPSLYRFGGLTVNADVDDDGDLDVLVGHDTGAIVIQVWLNDGSGFFQKGSLFFAGPPLVAADLDGDGHQDLITTGGLVFGNGDGTFAASSVAFGFLLDPSRDHIAIGDLDGDGRPDVAAVQDDAKVHVLFNDGNRAFTSVLVAYPYGGSTVGPRRADAVDVDRDGIDDLVVSPVAYGGNSSLVLLADGKRGFVRSLQLVLTSRGLADMDGDGDLDVVGDHVVRNNAWRTPADGYRLQYGVAGTGAGGVGPKLGATGPFRPGARVELRLSGAVGGAPAVIVIGTDESAQPGSPLAGLVQYVEPISVAVPVTVGGLAGAPGQGQLRLPFTTPMSAAGLSFYLQAFTYDAARQPLPIDYSQGLRLQLGVR